MKIKSLMLLAAAGCFAGDIYAELPACVTNQPILFVVRPQYITDHHNTATFFPSEINEANKGYFLSGGALKVLDPNTGSVRTLIETTEGSVRDPDVHFSGEKIVFSMRQNLADSFHVYEINADGTGLVQLTSMVAADDLNPIYMPSGKIVFTSTREPKYVMCNRHISGNLYSMDGDGANINQIGHSTLWEDNVSLTPEGRLMYSRWEYVDRDFGTAQGLWLCDPDGTGHVTYYGNNTSSPGAVLSGQMIPGTQTTVCTFGSCHDVPWGAIAIIDRRKGVDGAEPVVRTWPAGLESWVKVNNQTRAVFDTFKSTPIKYEDPYPLVDPDTGAGGRYFLCSRQVSGRHMALYLLDFEGDDVLIYEEGVDPVGCFDPIPLAPRSMPKDVNVHRDHSGADGRFYVQDVYEGTHMEGVERGDVKYLRVVESPEKRYHNAGLAWQGIGGQAPGVNWSSLEVKRILGTVPVEEDGSAYFTLPSCRFVYFQLLDADKRMIQSMRSGTMVMPNETQGCIGCHDNRALAPAAYGENSLPIASLREPSQLEEWYGEERNFGYLAEVQPVWDKHCLGCHDFGGTGSGKLVLAGDKTLFFNVSYTELWKKNYSGSLGGGSAIIKQAKSWGSHNSPLMNQILSGHNSGAMTAEEIERVATWIDVNGTYYPEYASNYADNLIGRSPLTPTQVADLYALTGKNFVSFNSPSGNPGPMVCFDRPEKSPCLSELTGTTYTDALALIQLGKDALEAMPREDMPGCQRMDPIDLWRDTKYADRYNREEMTQVALTKGLIVYDGQPLILMANRGAEGIDGVSALVQGEVLYSASPVTVQVCWGSVDGGDDADRWQYSTEITDQMDGNFELTLKGIVPGSNMYFRVFASNAEGVVGAYDSTVFDTRSLIDVDSDGMADTWETEHFGTSDAQPSDGDWDEDGFTNEEEYWAGTNPTNAASRLVIEALEMTGENLSIAWQSAEMGEYTLEYSTNLAVKSWIPVMVDRSATPPQNIYTTNVPTANMRYYRIKGHRTDR